MSVWQLGVSVWAVGAIMFRLGLELELQEEDGELTFGGHMAAAFWSVLWFVALSEMLSAREEEEDEPESPDTENQEE